MFSDYIWGRWVAVDDVLYVWAYTKSEFQVCLCGDPFKGIRQKYTSPPSASYQDYGVLRS